MTKSIFFMHFMLFFFSLLLWSGLILFYLSLYIRFNFMESYVPLGMLVVAPVFFRPFAYNLTMIMLKTFPFTPGIILMILFIFALPIFSFYYKNYGFGQSKRIIRNLKENSNEILLTFDDGPSKEWTIKIANILKKNGIESIFFLVGKNVEEDKKIVLELSKLNMELAVHSYSHKPLPFLYGNDINLEISKNVEAIKKITGKVPRFFRPPWGLYNREVIEIAREKGLIPILWSNTSIDWSGISSKEICKNVLKNLKGGDIILFHDGHKKGKSRKPTLDALQEIIDNIKKTGYSFREPYGILKK